MKHLKKFKFITEDEDEYEWSPPIKGPNDQDIVHWEIIIEGKTPYLKIATDHDYYYVELSNSEGHKSRHDEDW